MRFVMRIETLRLVIVLLHSHVITSSTQSLPCLTASGDNCTSRICPNTVVTYTCTITNGTAAGYTDWTLPTGTCPTNAFPNKIRLSQFVSGLCVPSGSISCGPYIASSGPASDPTYCLSSNLTVNITAAMNGSTVTCKNTNQATPSISTVVSLATISVFASPGPVGNMTAMSTSVDQLTVAWTLPTTGGVPTSYNVTINDSSSPVVIADNGSPVYTHTFTGLVSDTLYTVSVVAINCAGSSNEISKTTSTYSSITTSVMTDASYGTRMMVVRCSFNQSFYCIVCCSTDPSVPPDSSVYNISTTRGTEVTVSLQGLTSGQMYYCKAAATNTNSNNCIGTVVGGVFNFTFKLSHSDVTTPTGPGSPVLPPPSPSHSAATIAVGVVVPIAALCAILVISIIVVMVIRKKNPCSVGVTRHVRDSCDAAAELNRYEACHSSIGLIPSHPLEEMVKEYEDPRSLGIPVDSNHSMEPVTLDSYARPDKSRKTKMATDHQVDGMQKYEMEPIQPRTEDIGTELTSVHTEPKDGVTGMESMGKGMVT